MFSASTSMPLSFSSCRPAKFPSVSTITLFFPASQGAETTRIYYIGFLGQWSEVRFLFCVSAVSYCIVLLTIFFRNRDSASKTLLSQFTSLRPILPIMRKYRARRATTTCHRIEHLQTGTKVSRRKKSLKLYF